MCEGRCLGVLTGEGTASRELSNPGMGKAYQPSTRAKAQGAAKTRFQEAEKALAHDPEKTCPALMRGVKRFSEKIMRKQ